MPKFCISLLEGIVCCLIHQCCCAQSVNPGFSVESIGSQVIPLTTNKMTNILFPCAIKPGIKVSRDIMAERPKGTTNVLVLKAARKGFAATNLSVYGVDGRLYSFELIYAENPPVLNFSVRGQGVVIKMPLEKDAQSIEREGSFMRKSASAGKMQLILQGIYLRDSLMWFSLRLRNHSAIGYSPATFRWLVRDRRRLKRTAVQEIALRPAVESPLLPVPGEATQLVVAGFRPFILTKDKMLIIQVSERNGGGVLTMKISQRTLLRCKQVSSEKGAKGKTQSIAG